MQQTESADLAVRDLTARQRNIVQVIEDSIQRYGYAPTLREIGEAVGLASTSSVSHQLSRLAKKGYLSRDAGQAAYRGGASDGRSGPGTGHRSCER